MIEATPTSPDSEPRLSSDGYRISKLSLTRCQGESTFIGDDIEVRIEEVNGDRVRLKILAPINLAITRPDVIARSTNAKRQRELQQAARHQGGSQS